jgi:hypothetical protein
MALFGGSRLGSPQVGVPKSPGRVLPMFIFIPAVKATRGYNNKVPMRNAIVRRLYQANTPDAVRTSVQNRVGISSSIASRAAGNGPGVVKEGFQESPGESPSIEFICLQLIN